MILQPFQGRLVSGNKTQGNSPKGEWQKIEAVFEVNEGQYVNKYCVTFFNDKINLLSGIKVGDAVEVTAVLQSREYQGKYYCNLNAMNVKLIQPQQPSQQQPSQQQPANVQQFYAAIQPQQQQQQQFEAHELPF